MSKLEKDKTGSYYIGNYLNEKQQLFNAKCIVNFCKNFSNYKWSNNSICAILGNMSAESTLNPNLNEVGGTGYGLVQWTPKTNLLKRAKAINQYSTYDSIYTQMCVIEYEVKNGIQWIKTTSYPITFKEFIEDTTHSIEWLTGAWLKNYERPADQSQANILKRTTGDNNGHLGSSQFAEKMNMNVNSNEDGSINDMLNWAETIANNDKYLYKQGSAHGVSWNYDGNYFDCSSFVSFALHNGGYDLETQFSTANQKNELEDLGFNIIKFDKSKLKKGDIIFYNLNGQGHTEIVYNTNPLQLVGATTDSNPVSEQISIHNFYNSEWQWIARPTDGGSSVKERYFKINKQRMVFVYPKR